VEEVEVLSESVLEVSCRWCGHGRAVEVLGDEEPAPPTAPVTAPVDAGGPPA
jgi:hypothetical protein